MRCIRTRRPWRRPTGGRSSPCTTSFRRWPPRRSSPSTGRSPSPRWRAPQPAWPWWTRWSWMATTRSTQRAPTCSGASAATPRPRPSTSERRRLRRRTPSATSCGWVAGRCAAPLRRSTERQIGRDVDAFADRPRDRAPLGVVEVRPLGSLTPVLGAAAQHISDPDPPDDEDLLLEHHIAFREGLQAPLARVDPARLQRATEGASESASRGRHHIVECGGALRELTRGCPVVLAHLVMRAEDDRLVLGRQVCLADWPAGPDDSDAKPLVQWSGTR